MGLLPKMGYLKNKNIYIFRRIMELRGFDRIELDGEVMYNDFKADVIKEDNEYESETTDERPVLGGEP